MVWLYTIGSVIAVSLISIIVALPLLFKKKIPNQLLLWLLSFSVGALLGAVFIHFLPEAVSHGYTLGVAINLFIGFLLFFILEKFIHHHHKHDLTKGHSHAYHLAPLNLIGDGIHNFIDGLVIAGSYLVSLPLGIAATLSTIFHEVPQEIADFGILLYAGLSKKKALLFNFISAATAILGAVIGILLNKYLGSFTEFIIPFAAGTFLYIAASNLVPELHKENNFKNTLIQFVFIILGILLMIGITLSGLGHSH